MTVEHLLEIPPGGVTMSGLRLNIRVAIVFIQSWLYREEGCFILDGRAEDSATAEISRSQVRVIINPDQLVRFYMRVCLRSGSGSITGQNWRRMGRQ